MPKGIIFICSLSLILISAYVLYLQIIVWNENRGAVGYGALIGIFGASWMYKGIIRPYLNSKKDKS